MTPRLARALHEGVGALEALGLRYAIVGGLAVAAWGHVRATRDVDLYAELPTDRRPLLREQLEARGFRVPAMEGELQRFGVFRSRLVKQRVFLDIFDAVGPLGEAILSRRERLRVGSTDLWFASASDVAVLKAFSDPARDGEDLVALLAVPRLELDMAYIESWADKLDASIGGDDVTTRLHLAMAEASRSVKARR